MTYAAAAALLARACCCCPWSLRVARRLAAATTTSHSAHTHTHTNAQTADEWMASLAAYALDVPALEAAAQRLAAMKDTRPMIGVCHMWCARGRGRSVRGIGRSAAHACHERRRSALAHRKRWLSHPVCPPLPPGMTASACRGRRSRQTCPAAPARSARTGCAPRRAAAARAACLHTPRAPAGAQPTPRSSPPPHNPSSDRVHGGARDV